MKQRTLGTQGLKVSALGLARSLSIILPGANSRSVFA